MMSIVRLPAVEPSESERQLQVIFAIGLQCSGFGPDAEDFKVLAMLLQAKSMKGLERVVGIEPTYSAWKAAALPLCYTRDRFRTDR